MTREGCLLRLPLERLEEREVPAAVPWAVESFDAIAAGKLPSGWSSWTRVPDLAAFASVPRTNLAQGATLSSTGRSYDAARTWRSVVAASSVELSLDVFAGTLIPLQMIANGSGLDGAAPNYYAVSLRRGLHVELQQVHGGKTTTLATVETRKYLSQEWVRISLQYDGSTLWARILRTATNQYLTADGRWQSAATWALQRRVGGLPAGSAVGVVRPAHYAGAIHVDNFAIRGQQPPDALPVPSPVPVPTPAPVPTPTPTPVPTPTPTPTPEPTPTPVDSGTWTSWSTGSGASVAGSPTGVPWIGTTNGTGTARAWLSPSFDASELQTTLTIEREATAAVFLRGSNLQGDWPNHVAMLLGQIAGAKLVLSSSASTIELAAVKPQTWPASGSFRVRLSVADGIWRAEIVRADTGEYLTAGGRWQAAATAALAAVDDSLPVGGSGGLEITGGSGRVTVQAFALLTRP